MDSAALQRRCDKLSSILDVARSMAVEHNLDTLLALILDAAARVAEADRCSIFLVDRDRGQIWTKLAQGVGPAQEIRTPLGAGIAGHVATTGVAINIPNAYEDARFNRTIDQATGYHTRNILTVPMRRVSGQEGGVVTGVLQALNRKDGNPFNAEDQELLEGLGAQAAAAIENTILTQEIQRLFEGFVHASVVAIEARDPTTAGHSERVAKLTVGLALKLERAPRGGFAGLRFSEEELQQMRYAALLHDFGKVGVREHVLVKANKLYPHELEILKARFDLIRRTLELESARRRLALAGARGIAAATEALAEEEVRLASALTELDGLRDFAFACNRPTVLAEGGFERLQDLAQMTFEGPRGDRMSYLSPEEIERLSIAKGSLSAEERQEIESHVTHTFRFLTQIPWTRNLKRIPDIAYGHHEKLDGSGYPRRLSPHQIGVETRMMTIADIYDALTANDRPYKKALPHDAALDILQVEAKRGLIDSELLTLFIEAGVPAQALAGR